ncbi:tetratricopeptide repeat protein [Krasilnikovia sp. MM14-A1259]|uniref:tetratricopeptide repeat protein n=1 Tax=Krasilnikovia sp. MM14-A1259 TaxID=3373539 RepID=UPI0037FE8247
MRSVQELWALLREAKSMPSGEAQIALTEQVLRHADASGDRELAFATRIHATHAYVYGGEPAKAFVPFSRCLSDFDSDPADFHQRYQYGLLWHFKDMVSALLKFPEVPLARTYAVLDDMERRYRDSGYGSQAVHKYRMLVAAHVGDDAAADDRYERWQTTPRDRLSDCAGCDPTDQIAYLALRGRHEEAVELAQPILAGRLTCVEQPHKILTALLEPYVSTGRLELATNAHRRGYRLLRPRLADLREIGDHVALCALSGNEIRGVEIVQRHVDWLDRAPSPSAAMHFAAASAMLLRRLPALGHTEVQVSRRGRGDVPAAVLAEELAAFATGTAARFDARNGTSAQSGMIAATLAAEPFPEPFRLSPTARPSSVRPAPAPEPMALPQDADPNELLDLADELERQDRNDEQTALMTAYDRRFRADDPGPLARARRLMQIIAGGRWAGDTEGTVDSLAVAESMFQEAGVPAGAATAVGIAGLTRVIAGEVEEGLAMVGAEVAFHGDGDDQWASAEACARLAAALSATGRHEEALEAQDRADAYVAKLDDPRMAARYAMLRAPLLDKLSRRAEAETAARSALEFYRAHGPGDRVARAAVTVGKLFEWVAAAPCEAAFDEAVACGDTSVALEARLGRARARIHLDRDDEAIDDFVEAIAWCTARGLTERAAEIRLELAEVYQELERLEEAVMVAEEAVVVLGRRGRTEDADKARNLLATTHSALGDPHGAVFWYDALIEGIGDDGDLARRAELRGRTADLMYDADEDAEAAARYAAAADDLHAVGDLRGEVRALRRLLMSRCWSGDLAGAEEALRRAEQRYEALGGSAQRSARWERAMLDREAARLMLQLDRAEDAVGYVTDVPQRLREIQYTQDAQDAEVLLGRALLANGRAAEVEDLLRPLVSGEARTKRIRRIAAKALAEALDELGRTDEAAALREREGV